MSSELKEKPLGDWQGDDLLNAKQIDALLERKQATAVRYASEPDRFMLFTLELEVRGNHGKHLVMYDKGDWSCNCGFFADWRTCSHTRATALLLKDSLYVSCNS